MRTALNFAFPQDEDSDDEPAILSLSGMSLAESTLSDEVLPLDQIKDLKNLNESEGAVVVFTPCDVRIQ